MDCPPKSLNEKGIFIPTSTKYYRNLWGPGGHFEVSPLPGTRWPKQTSENQKQTLPAQCADSALGRGQHTSQLPLLGPGGLPAHLHARTSCPNRLAKGFPETQGMCRHAEPCRVGWEEIHRKGSKSVWLWDEKSELHSENFKACAIPEAPGPLS